jgi:hypothetical protein
VYSTESQGRALGSAGGNRGPIPHFSNKVGSGGGEGGGGREEREGGRGAGGQAGRPVRRAVGAANSGWSPSPESESEVGATPDDSPDRVSLNVAHLNFFIDDKVDCLF